MTRFPRYAPLALALGCLSAAAQPTTRPVDLIRQGADLAERDAAALTVERDAARSRADEFLSANAILVGKVAALEAEVARLRPKLLVGLNLDENTDYATDAKWANVALTFAGWGKPDKPWEPNPALTLAPDGAPLADAGCYTYATGYASGDYAFSMDGSGAPAFSGKGKFASPPSRAGNVVTGTVRLNADAPGLLQFRVTGIDPANPPRNLRLIVPGLPADTAQVANPAFVVAVKPFGPFRLNVGPGRMNVDEAGTVADFAARVRPAEFPQTTRRGVALEHLIGLANDCGKDVWLSVPDRASDDYVRQFGALVRDRLASGRKVYVEYSNEGWNTRFGQWARIHADARSNAELTATDENERHWQQMGWQARRLGVLLKPILGDRVRIVLGGQASYAWNSADRLKPGPAEVALDYVAAKFGPPSQWVDVLAVACYRDAGSDASSVASIVAGWDAALASADLRAKDARHLAVARKYGLRLWAYESAITVKGRQTAPDPRDAAQVDPRAGERVAALLAYQETAGFEGTCYFVALGKRAQQTEGHYPLAESLLTIGMEPKWQAARNFAAARAGN